MSASRPACSTTAGCSKARAFYPAEEDLRSGHLVQLLPDYPLAMHWLKAMVPRMKIARPAVREFVEFLKLRLQTFGESVSSDERLAG